MKFERWRSFLTRFQLRPARFAGCRIGRSLWLIQTLAVGLIGLPLAGVSWAELESRSRPLNVLFIAVDDLRPQLGCYGHSEMVTPSLDRLAGQSRRFENHFVQVPTCGASRCALLTGRYPLRPVTYENGAFELLLRETEPPIVTLPALFRERGYHTISIGKISHSPDGLLANGKPELPAAWDTVGMPAGKWKDGWSAFFGYADGSTRVRSKSPATESTAVSDDGYPDGLIADAAIAQLRTLEAEPNKPFFLAVGFFKPHLPFNAPQRYWDLYDPAVLPAPQNSKAPANVNPVVSLHKSGELLGQYTGFSQPGLVSDEEARRLRHAYAACVSYVDAQIGRIIDELDCSNLAKQTIVVVWGDHGWHLGDQGIWGKHTLHDVALRSPLIVRTPMLPRPGEAATGIVETVDIYPTLVELCGLPRPIGLDGQSFLSQLTDPSALAKAAAYGFWRGGKAHSIRTDRFRLTLTTATRNVPSKVMQVELYDHQSDPFESVNIAAKEPDVVQQLRDRLLGFLSKQRSASGEHLQDLEPR